MIRKNKRGNISRNNPEYIGHKKRVMAQKISKTPAKPNWKRDGKRVLNQSGEEKSFKYVNEAKRFIRAKN